LEAGDFFLGSALSTTLTKLVLRSFLEEDLEDSQKHAFAVEVLLIMVNILKLGKSPQTKNQIDDVRQTPLHLLYRFRHASKS
jgi:predicted Kef-type K+ transport protein